MRNCPKCGKELIPLPNGKGLVVCPDKDCYRKNNKMNKELTRAITDQINLIASAIETEQNPREYLTNFAVILLEQAARDAVRIASERVEIHESSTSNRR